MFRGDFIFAIIYVAFLFLSGFLGNSISLSSKDGLILLGQWRGLVWVPCLVALSSDYFSLF